MRAAPLPLGTLLHSRYRIISLAGGGGMGLVYKAADTAVGDRPVAVKELRPVLDPGESLDAQQLAVAKRLFAAEAMMLASLQYPNLPRIFDHFEERDGSFLVMEFIEGRTLEARLKQAPGSNLPLDEALSIASQICATLEYLHGQRPPVIFRDLKPSNVMLTTRGDVYLIDFGIARVFKPGQSLDTRMAFTPGYAAPEQLLHATQTDARSDIFSLGVTLYQMLTGISPADDPYEFASMRPRRSEVPVALDQLVMRMVQLDPAGRPSSDTEIKRELATISGSGGASQPLPAKASPYTPSPPTPRPATPGSAPWPGAAAPGPKPISPKAAPPSDPNMVGADVFGGQDPFSLAQPAAAPPKPAPPPPPTPAYTPPAPTPWPGATPPAPQAAYTPPAPTPVYPPAYTPPVPNNMYAPLPQPRKRRGGLIAAIIGGIVLLCLVASAILYFSSQSAGQNAIPSATQTAAAQQTAVVNETVIYHDSMKDSPSGWAHDSQCIPKADGYHVAGEIICLGPDSASATDVDITVTVTAIKTGSDTTYGIVFRHASQGNFYSFEISPGGQWGVFKTINKHFTAISDFRSDATIHTGSKAANTLRVLAIGAHFVCYVNGQQVGALDDSTFRDGTMGLVNSDSVTTTSVAFTNLTVAKPN